MHLQMKKTRYSSTEDGWSRKLLYKLFVMPTLYSNVYIQLPKPSLGETNPNLLFTTIIHYLVEKRVYRQCYPAVGSVEEGERDQINHLLEC